MSAHAIIVAGGTGKRMGASIPKQLLELDGVTIIERTLRQFARCSAIESIVIVAATGVIDRIAEIASRCDIIPPVTVVPGGTERQDSVLNGINALPERADIIVIHDAVRPFITPSLIVRCIEGAKLHDAVTVVHAIHETVKEVCGDLVVNTPDRDTLRITQTPQAFKRDILMAAHERATADNFTGTDDCMLVEHAGHPVHIIEGTDWNMKITTPTDLALAGAILTLFDDGAKQC